MRFPAIQIGNSSFCRLVCDRLWLKRAARQNSVSRCCCAENIPTVIGTQYTLSYDVFIATGQLHNLNDFCVSADSNGQLIVRDEGTVIRDQADGHAGGGHCGGSAIDGEVGQHCHGVVRLCPQTANHWVTISGTYIASNEVTTFALHSVRDADDFLPDRPFRLKGRSQFRL